MATITNYIKWASNTAELKASLAAGTGQIVAMKDAVDKTARALGGEGLLRAANNTTAAIQQLGGATKLTAAEKERINLQLTKAIEKYRLLGHEAPAAMVELQKATMGAGPPTQTLTQRMVTLGAAVGSFIGTFGANLVQQGVSSLISMGRAAFTTAGHVLDLANKTGLSATSIQQMQFVAHQTGGTVEQFAEAAFKLGVRLAGGSGSVQKAVEDLGLSFILLRAQSPDEQFRQIMLALGDMASTTERNRLGVEIFGKSFSALAAASVEGYARIAASARTTGDVELAVLDARGDAWTAFTDNAAVSIRNFLGSVVMGFGKSSESMDGHVQWLKHVESGYASVAEAAKRTSDIQLAAEPAVVAAVKSYTVQLAEAKAEVAALTTEERAQIAAAKTLGISTEEVTAKFGLSEEALRLMTEQTKDATKADTALATQRRAWGNTLAEMQIAEIAESQKAAKALDQKRVAIAAVGVAMPLYTAHMIEAMRASMGLTAEGTIPLIDRTLELTSATLDMGTAMKFATTEQQRLNREAQSTSGIFGGIKSSFSGLLQGLTGGNGITGLFSNLGKGIMDGVGSIVTGGISSLISSGLGLAVKGLKSLFGESQGHKDLVAANAEIKTLQDELLKTHGSIENIIAVGGAAGQALADAWGSQNQDGLQWFTTLTDQFNQELAETGRIEEENARKTAEAARTARGSFADITGALNILQAKLANTESITRLSDELAKAGAGGVYSLGTILREVESLTTSLGDADPAIAALQAAIATAAQTGVWDFASMGAAIMALKGTMATPIIVPVEFKVGDVDWPDVGESKGGVSFKPPTQSDIETFLRNNPGDEGRVRQAFTNITDEVANAAGIFSFAGGSGGLMDFGAGQLAMLHGRERVQTEAEVRSGPSGYADLLTEVRSLRAEQAASRRALRADLFLAVRDGLAHGRAA